jgi:hypothetical protein
MSDRCFWCGRRFEPRNDGGKPQRFCSTRCRRALDAAGRRYIFDALAAGSLTVADLRRDAPRALRYGTRDGGDDDAATPAPDPAFARLLDELSAGDGER